MRKKGDLITNIEVKKATIKTKSLNLLLSDDIIVMVNKKVKTSEIEPEILLNEKIEAPITQGQEMGIIKYNIDGVEYEAKLLAETDVKLKTYYIEILVGAGIFLIIIVMISKTKK